uniref:Ribonuclease H n=1 Tax=Tanacetum cinerariifolium TaxID=118510 RepID=A0A699KJS4_TANCI|nr:ribonuclease H [Tanacetum cinerariifolium]
MSSAEAEYVSLSACYAQVLWMRTQLTDYGFHFDKIPMFCDSKADIAISCNHVQHSRTKHIGVRYHFIKEKVKKGIVELFFVETEYQLADLFTKALPVERFQYLIRRLELKRRDSIEYASEMELSVQNRINDGLDLFLTYLNDEMVVDLRYFNSLKLEVESLTSQLETQRTQFVNEIDRLSREYYYADHMNAILGMYTELDEVTNLQCDYLELLEKCKGLEIELSKSKMMSKVLNQDLKAQLQDKGIVISELKKLMEKQKGKSVETKFEKSSVIRQPNAFKSQRPSILGKPTTFSNSFKRKDFSKSTSVTQNNVANDFSKPVTAQILPANKMSILKNTNVLNLGMYKIHTDHTQTRTSKLHPDSRKTNKRVSLSTGVIPTTSVSRPQLKRNPMEDRVLHTNSRGKKQEVENHRRNVKLYM